MTINHIGLYFVTCRCE